MRKLQAVVMAGGMGTRIASVAGDLPKPMVPVGGKPVLEHLIRSLTGQGYRRILLVTGYRGDVIREYFGDGAAFGASLTYFQEPRPLGTAGALFPLLRQGRLEGDFFLINGDLMMDMDFGRMQEFHFQRQAQATILIHPNSHPQDSALICADSGKRIVRWVHPEEPREDSRNRVNAGVHILSSSLLLEAAPSLWEGLGGQADADGIAAGEISEIPGKIDLDRQVLEPALARGRLFAYDSTEYVRDMGTPERYAQVCRDYGGGKVRSRNLRVPQKAVFLDRDGTINRDKGFLTKKEDMELIDGAADAIARINRSGYLAIVVTNQPVVARGECTPEELEGIHNRMETLLGQSGAWVDDIFFCPHHPDRGYPGERTEYKVDCDCRKPKPGMLYAAAKQYHIDLSASFMVGDGERDVLAGKAAGCKSVYLCKNESDSRKLSCPPFAVCRDLADFADRYL